MKTKLKIPKLFRFKSKKLRSATSRRPLRIAAAATDYEEMAEPNMKLSRALLIVLLLHVVAVAGIIAFNAIKTRQSSASPVAASAAKTTIGETGKPSPSNWVAVTAQKGSAKSTSRDGAKIDRPRPGDSTAAASSNRIYVVAKGDNPVTIAKKFKVSYDDLVALNHIDDPRKLQIGQKLLIPNKPTKGKKDE
jgi:LysM repeat protein